MLLAFAFNTCLADLTLGRFSLSATSAPSLKTTAPLRSSVRSFRFVGKVGGVAFDALAQPEAGLKVKSLTLSYSAAEPDGHRLKLVINGKPVAAEIYDWELLPIARYAASDSTSCFTLFGELEDKKEAEKLRDEGARILNYDAAFKDTLLGLRLFQLDVLVLDEELGTDLPKSDGHYLLGAGEQAPDLPKTREQMRKYEKEKEDLERRGASTDNGFRTEFGSYVICDQTVDLRFGLADGQLILTGEPFYYFWVEDDTDQSAVIDRARLEAARKLGIVGKNDTLAKLEEKKKAAEDRVEALTEKLLLEEAKKAGLIPETAGSAEFEEKLSEVEKKQERELAVARLEAAKQLGLAGPDDEWAAVSRRLSASLFNGTPEQRKAAETKLRDLRTESLKRLSAEGQAAKDFIEKVEALSEKVAERLKVDGLKDQEFLEMLGTARKTAMERVRDGVLDEQRKATYLDKFSQEHTKLTATLAQANPAVWDAARMTMRYSAFFRYCKKNHPAAWKKFLAELKRAEAPEPKVTTPTVMHLPPRK